MENIKIKILTSLLFCLMVTSIFAQGNKEIGLFVGPSAFSTDYGALGNSEANGFGNVGIAIGLVYYFDFGGYGFGWNRGTGFFADHVKVRAEISYMSAKLKHYGEYAESPGLGGQQLRAMRGEANVFNAGAQMEFHLYNYSVKRYRDLNFSPYASVGLFGDYYSPSLEYDEDLGLYPKWEGDNHNLESGITASISAGLGTRVRIGDYSDIFFEARMQFFFTDWVDGLDAQPGKDPNPYGTSTGNKHNDAMGTLQIGYIYYF